MSIPVRSRLADDTSVIEQLSLRRFFPDQEGTQVAITPTAIGATLARVFPFVVPRAMVVNQIAVKTPAAAANAFQFAIFDRTGAIPWTSGAVTTVAGWTILTAGLPITLAEGTYYWAVTNNNTISATGALAGSSPLATASVPRWGTVPATLGAMPATINPAAITEIVGGFPIYVVLSNWTT